MSIYNIPDELLVEMCEGWDTPSLLAMSQAYDRVYQQCSKVIEKRKYEAVVKKIRGLSTDLQFITPMMKEDGTFTIRVHFKNNPIYKIYKNSKGYIYLPRLNIISTKENIRRYLQSEGLTEDQIEFELSQVDNSWKEVPRGSLRTGRSISWDERYLT